MSMNNHHVVRKPAESTEEQNLFELRTLLETSRLLIESRETDFVLNNLLLITMDKMLVPRGAILIHEPGSDNYRVTRIEGKARVEVDSEITLPWKSDDFESIVIDPLKHDIKPPELFEGQNRGLFFNLRTSNDHLGYLYLSRKGNDEVLDEREIEFVESITIISSAAIANSRICAPRRKINRKLDRLVIELSTLFELSNEFNSMVNREKIASTFKSSLLGQLQAKKLLLLFKIGKRYDLLTSSGLTRRPSARMRKRIIRLSEGTQRISESWYEEVPFLEENGITYLVPLHMQGEKIAVIGVSDKANGKELSRPELNFLQSLGNLAVLSIQKTLFLKERIEKERLEEEISIAKNIQMGLFPDKLPDIEGLDVAVKNIPSQLVGGDYYDVVQTPDTNHIFAIGDVTGKGIPAALLMANLQSMLHVLLPVDIPLTTATGRINNLIFENTPSDKFITFFWGKYFHHTRTSSYINAGHNPPLLLKNEGENFKELREGGLILGALSPREPYKESEVKRSPGDVLVFYADGVTDAFSKEGEIYGEERLKEIIIANRYRSAEEILERIVDDVHDYSDNDLSDDITMIVVRVH